MREFILTIAASIISILAFPSLLQTMEDWHALMAKSQAAQVVTILSSAGRGYLSSHLNSVPANASLVVQLSDLQSAGFLPNTFNGCTDYGCQWVLEFKLIHDTQYVGFVFSQFSNPLPDRVGNAISVQVGVDGGWVPQNDSGLIINRSGRCSMVSDMTMASAIGVAWSQPLTGFSQGRCGQLAAIINLNSAYSDDLFLHRNYTPGLPILNTLNTPLIMAVQRSANDPCNEVDAFGVKSEPMGAIASDNVGRVLYCDGAHWSVVGQGLWKSPASERFSDLPLIGNVDGDTRLVAELGRAFSWTQGAWQPLGVDSAGNLTLPGSAGIGATLFMNVAVGGSTRIDAGGSEGELIVSANSSPQSPTFLIRRDGIHIGSVGGTGLSCGVGGLIANGDASDSGYLVICQNGVWQPLGGRIQESSQYGYTGSDAASGQVIPAPVCPTLAIPQVVATLTSIPVDATNTIQIKTKPNVDGNGKVLNWTVIINDAAGNNVPNATAIVSTFCSYLGQ